MGLKIFLLMATFCITQIKPKFVFPPVKLTVKDHLEINEKTEGFADAITLSEAKSLWKKPNSIESFKNCYDTNGKNEYKEAIDSFFSQIAEAGSAFSNNLSTHYKKEVEKALSHINNTINLVKKYEKEFSNQVDFESITEFMKNYRSNIEEEFKLFYAEIKGISKATRLSSHTNAILACEKEFQKEIRDMKKKSDNIVKKIQQCMQKEN